MYRSRPGAASPRGGPAGPLQHAGRGADLRPDHVSSGHVVLSIKVFGPLFVHVHIPDLRGFRSVPAETVRKAQLDNTIATPNPLAAIGSTELEVLDADVSANAASNSRCAPDLGPAVRPKAARERM